MAVLTEGKLWFLVHHISLRKQAIYFIFLRETSLNVKSSIANVFPFLKNLKGVYLFEESR